MKRHSPGRPLIRALGADPIGRCAGCWLLPERCVCAHAQRHETRLRVIIYRHWKEGLKSANSARLVSLVLPSVEIRDVGRPDPRLHPLAGDIDDDDLPADMTPAEVDPTLLEPGARLLYPPGEATALPPDAPVTTIVIPDGTWGQTRRLVKRVPGLAAMPRLAIAPEARTGPRVLTPPAEWAVSTLEAIGYAFIAVGEPAAGRALITLYDRFAENMRWESRPRE